MQEVEDKKIKLIALLISVLAYSLVWGQTAGQSASQSVAKENVQVVIGVDEIKKINFTPDPRVHIGNEEILEVQLIPQMGEVILKGMKEGRTSLKIRDEYGNLMADFVVSVTATSNSRIVQELRSFFKTIEGIEDGMEGEHVSVG